MRMTLLRHRNLVSGAIALSAALALSGCGGMAGNRSLESVHQPVVEKTNYVFDVATGPSGLSLPEQRRLTAWFDAMNLKYGDRLYIDAMAQVYSNVSKVLVDSHSNSNLLYLPLDKLIQQAATLPTLGLK